MGVRMCARSGHPPIRGRRVRFMPKMDEMIIALRETRNELVGPEHRDPKEIASVVKDLEIKAATGNEGGCAGATAQPVAPAVRKPRARHMSRPICLACRAFLLRFRLCSRDRRLSRVSDILWTTAPSRTGATLGETHHGAQDG
jgi:hypothetical protein